MWGLNDQFGKLAVNMSCPTVQGSIECMRAKPVEDLQKSLLATGLQFQPITDNITMWKKYVSIVKSSNFSILTQP